LGFQTQAQQLEKNIIMGKLREYGIKYTSKERPRIWWGC